MGKKLQSRKRRSTWKKRRKRTRHPRRRVTRIAKKTRSQEKMGSLLNRAPPRVVGLKRRQREKKAPAAVQGVARKERKTRSEGIQRAVKAKARRRGDGVQPEATVDEERNAERARRDLLLLLEAQ